MIPIVAISRTMENLRKIMLVEFLMMILYCSNSKIEKVYEKERELKLDTMSTILHLKEGETFGCRTYIHIPIYVR